MKKLTLALVLTLSTSYAGTFSDQVFYFTGTCSDCTGTATATLTVAGTYVLGTDFQQSDLVFFQYHSNLLDTTVSPADKIFDDFHGTMPVGLGAADIVIEGDFQFRGRSDGTWDIGSADFGTNGVWSQPNGTAPTPEPATWLTIGLGLALLTKRRLHR
jgi:hypothetical protein